MRSIRLTGETCTHVFVPKAPVWLYFVIPVISGFVGWFTNVLALHMTFYPLDFKGVKIWQPEGQPFGFFGWQVRTTLTSSLPLGQSR